MRRQAAGVLWRPPASNHFRHGRACPGHPLVQPGLAGSDQMPATSAGMTTRGSARDETVAKKVLRRPIPAQGGSRWPKRRTGRRPMVAQAAPALNTARGSQRPARRCRLILALAHHAAILTPTPHPVHRNMDRGIIEGGGNEPSLTI